MLDFYIINNDKTFDNLQNKGIIDMRFDYYADFRLETELIRQMRHTIIQKQLQVDSNVKKLTQLFGTADKKQSGLIAYGD